MTQKLSLEQLNQWLDYLHSQRRCSEHTIAAYRRDLKLLIELFPEKNLEELSHDLLRSAVARLHARDYSPRSLARIVAAWRSFYQWLSGKVALKSNPASHLKTPKVGRPLPKAMTVEQTMVFLDRSQQLSSSTEPKDRCDIAMFELLYSSGLRLSELVQLDYQYRKTDNYESQGWLDLEEKEIKVIGKGNKTRLVPLGGKAAEAIRHWLEKRDFCLAYDATDSDKAALFLGVRGRRINPRAVQLRLKEMALKTGADSSIHPHMMRHSFASHMLQSAQDLRAVQELLGHSNISTTQIYTRLDFQHLAKAYDAAHPRAQRKDKKS
ncbi:MAG: tyrosine recombinase XerC [Alcaligenaceae bacterium]|nr:tyrosine recombinase XerC [Alcaligenaceae bacterium]